uniref:Putative plant transposon protein domain-containing protein n=1 Tax=Gossypium raimondii TaxID=29730 RepID=A0A0D2QJ58_GOSRA|nr:hypothetical protein B456_003G115700 [Gossypium raimondii]
MRQQKILRARKRTAETENNIDKYLQQLQPYTFIQEQVLNPLIRNYKRVWEIAIEREWTSFCLPSEESIIILVTYVKVKGFNVLVTDRSIFQFYDTSYYYRDYLYKIDLKEFKNVNMKETYQIDTAIPETFNQALMTPKAKIWMKFVCLRIWTTANTNPKQIRIGTWIYRNMIEFVRNQAKGTFFPHLITELCKRARGPKERMDNEMNPPKKFLGDDEAPTSSLWNYHVQSCIV